MSLKFILLCFTTFLLVQSCFGRALPEESSENELAPRDSKDNESGEEYPPQFFEFFLKERKFVLKSIHDAFESLEEIKEGEDLTKQFYTKVFNRVRRNFFNFLKSLTSEEEEYFLNKDAETELYTILHNLYETPTMSDSEESSDNEVLTIKDKKQIFLAQQIVNYAYLLHISNNEELDEDDFYAQLVDFYKETVKEYYDSLTKEEQEKKKPYMDFVEKSTVESVFGEKTEQEDAEELELLSQFFDLTDLEKFKVAVFYTAHCDSDLTFIDNFKKQAEKYSDSLPKEKSELKKYIADHLEQLNNIDGDDKQTIYAITWLLTLKDDEEGGQDS